MKDFRLHTANIPFQPDRLTIITTALFNPGGYPKTEYFVVIPGLSGSVIKQSIKFNAASFKEASMELDQEFMFEEALNQAKLAVNAYLDEKRNENKHYPAQVDFISEEDPKRALMHFWVRGNIEAQLLEIADSTNLEDLSNFINTISAIQIARLQPL